MTLPVWEFTIVRISFSLSPQERQVLLELSSTMATFSARKNSTAPSVPNRSRECHSERWFRANLAKFGGAKIFGGGVAFLHRAWAGTSLIARASAAISVPIPHIGSGVERQR
jgi:hypothetical protein